MQDPGSCILYLPVIKNRALMLTRSFHKAVALYLGRDSTILNESYLNSLLRIG
jgi:hypothetical protein